LAKPKKRPNLIVGGNLICAGHRPLMTMAEEKEHNAMF
jgi:hypothetical protein